jgi:fermentation-respiration switch protein FrsA (DUF1100 family)
LFKKVLTRAVIAYLLILAFLYFFQRNLQYLPIGKSLKIPENFKVDFLADADGLKFLTWCHPAPKNRKIILYFHGNAGNIGDRLSKLSSFVDANYGVFAFSYRGYLGSEGKPSEDGLIKNAEAALTYLHEQGYQDSDIILFGESLGSGVAVQVASKSKFAAVILESPFSSIVSVAQSKYWFAPVSLMIKDRFDSAKFAPEITSPVLIFHGTDDKVVSISEGKKLFELIKSPKKFIEIQGAGHLEFPEDFLISEMKNFLEN